MVVQSKSQVVVAKKGMAKCHFTTPLSLCQKKNGDLAQQQQHQRPPHPRTALPSRLDSLTAPHSLSFLAD